MIPLMSYVAIDSQVQMVFIGCVTLVLIFLGMYMHLSKQNRRDNNYRLEMKVLEREDRAEQFRLLEARKSAGLEVTTTTERGY